MKFILIMLTIIIFLFQAVPSVLFSAVVYGVPIVYTAGIVVEFVFTTFFKQGRPVRPKAVEKNAEVNALDK